MNPILLLQLLCRLNPLPSGRNLDQNPLFINPQFLVQLDDMECLFNGGLFIKREPCIDFCGDSSGDDFEDFITEFNEETVECVVDLLVDFGGFGFSVGAGCVDEFCVGGFFGGSEEEGGVAVPIMLEC
jgi:hypothetical protein